MSERQFPVGRRIELPGHGAEPVVLESVRPLGDGYECRVRLIDRSPDEAVLSPEEAVANVGRQSEAPTSARRADTENIRVPVAKQKARHTGNMASANSACYSSKIIKAGALLADTKTLLAHWDVAASVQDNMERIRRENLFGKASRSRVEDVLAILRQRFLGESCVTKALVVLVQKRLSAAALDRILYFHAARSDRLLHDTVTEILTPLQARGITEIDTLEVQRPLKKWVEAGKTSGEWSEPTILRIAQGLLSALRDFGVLQGAAKKRIAPAYLPVAAFAYLVFYFKQRQPSGVKLVELPDWKLFFLPREGVERFLFEAHQHNLLEYHAAGSVTRLTFPATTLEEYAHVIAQRAD